MLPNHAPLIIAEQFGTLETLYPGRIDLGLGRAPGSDGATQHALRRASGLEFPALVEELRGFLAPSRPGQPVRAIPGEGLDIPIWLLGSSDFSARMAAELGLPFSFAGHFSPEGMAAMRLYRHLFKPSATLSKPYSMIGVPVIAAETDEAARFQATTQELKFLSWCVATGCSCSRRSKAWTAYGTNGNARRSNNDWARPSSAARTRSSASSRRWSPKPRPMKS